MSRSRRYRNRKYEIKHYGRGAVRRFREFTRLNDDARDRGDPRPAPKPEDVKQYSPWGPY